MPKSTSPVVGSWISALGRSPSSRPDCQTLEVRKGAKNTSGTIAGENGKDAEFWHEIVVQRLRVADRQFGYCLDHLRRINSADLIEVKKYKEVPILGKVTGNADDKTRAILETLIRTLFIAVSGNPDYQLKSATRSFAAEQGKIVTVFRAEFDPFDPERSTIINQALRQFGFCMALEDYTFDIDHISIDSYCDNPGAATAHAKKRKHEYDHGPHKRTSLDAATLADPAGVRGIFYRPRIPYKYYLFVKENMQARGGWKLRASQMIEMENIAPILSVGIDRAIFTQRNTTLVFDEGMLKNVCVYKKSELVEAVKIPLVVVQSVVALPANIIQVRIDQTLGQASLVTAQNEVIKTQQRLMQQLAGQAPGASGKAPEGAARSAAAKGVSSLSGAYFENESPNAPAADAGVAKFKEALGRGGGDSVAECAPADTNAANPHAATSAPTTLVPGTVVLQP
ncbi:MAG: hypothetical protein SFW09_05630 [Hyphomicrobiaceae bacterium]|nr:hypothetical protein [Hyphomicrobiaceae bacterium]